MVAGGGYHEAQLIQRLYSNLCLLGRSWAVAASAVARASALSSSNTWCTFVMQSKWIARKQLQLGAVGQTGVEWYWSGVEWSGVQYGQS